MNRIRPLIILVVVLAIFGAVGGWLLGRADIGRAGGTTELKALVGSEKLAYFNDPAVKQALAKHGWSVRADQAGSRQMPTRTPGYDFAFPSSRAAAAEIRAHAHAAGDDVVVFSSPLAIATFSQIVDLLQVAKLAARDPADRVWRLDLKALADANQRNLKWTDIPGNTTRPVAQNVLVATARPADSNSAAMFAYLLNQATGGNIGAIAKLFTDQGAVDSTSEEPFEAYLRTGGNSAPMVLVYEAQFVDQAVNVGFKGQETLLYPTPTVMCRHTIVPLSDNGVTVAKLLAGDPELQRLAAKHGFRTADASLSGPVLDKVRPGDAALPKTVDGALADPDFQSQQALLKSLEEKMS
ncbi:hypothetical protein [Dactylosporangium sp. NPDC051541]|uniref:hypothetical protein n=1 Tax=Dactylosporangium sp. NPDC051541 TaxID=3363977 RepID=UPI0037AF170B